MKLSELPLNEFSSEITLHRDGEFHFASKLHNDLSGRLTPCKSKENIDFANNDPKISCLIVSRNFIDVVDASKGCLLADNPMKALFSIHDHLAKLKSNDIKTPSNISPDAEIHETAVIAEFNVNIHSNAIIGPYCTIEEDVTIGENVKLLHGCHIGCRPFDLNNQHEPHYALQPLGGVIIGENSTMISNARVAKSTFGGNTTIGNNAIFDANVFIAHDCNLGNNVRIAANTFIGGRTVLKDNVYVGPQVTISNGIHIGRAARVSIGAVVIKDVPDESVVSGHYAVPHLTWMRAFRRSLK